MQSSKGSNSTTDKDSKSRGRSPASFKLRTILTHVASMLSSTWVQDVSGTEIEGQILVDGSRVQLPVGQQIALERNRLVLNDDEANAGSIYHISIKNW
ncbi:hypothetical protein Cni_G11531 [Canna indica]|uniref:Uncharacterized protein n=1 Tax=Canna indica TaxID=4628 RepID=A0AAQ3K6A7_9LILI|nr:hypothetical protein Cni_G11531 [Canna indica]